MSSAGKAVLIPGPTILTRLGLAFMAWGWFRRGFRVGGGGLFRLVFRECCWLATTGAAGRLGVAAVLPGPRRGYLAAGGRFAALGAGAGSALAVVSRVGWFRAPVCWIPLPRRLRTWFRSGSPARFGRYISAAPWGTPRGKSGSRIATADRCDWEIEGGGGCHQIGRRPPAALAEKRRTS
jgi:hypothetical protein